MFVHVRRRHRTPTRWPSCCPRGSRRRRRPRGWGSSGRRRSSSPRAWAGRRRRAASTPLRSPGSRWRWSSSTACRCPCRRRRCSPACRPRRACVVPSAGTLGAGPISRHRAVLTCVVRIAVDLVHRYHAGQAGRRVRHPVGLISVHALAGDTAPGRGARDRGARHVDDVQVVGVEHDRRVGRQLGPARERVGEARGRHPRAADGGRVGEPLAALGRRRRLQALVVDELVARVDQHPVAVTAAVLVPQVQVRRLRPRLPAARAAVVLLAGHHAAGIALRDGQVVGLRPRLIRAVQPVVHGRARSGGRRAAGRRPAPGRLVAVGRGDVRAAVVALVDAVGHARVPCHRVLVGVQRAERERALRLQGGVVPVGVADPREAAVGRLAQVDVGVEDVVLVGRVDPQPAEHPLIAAAGRVRRLAAARERGGARLAVGGVVEALVGPVRRANSMYTRFGSLGATAMPMRPRLGSAFRPVPGTLSVTSLGGGHRRR